MTTVTSARAGLEDGAERVERMLQREGPMLLRAANQHSLCHDDALDAYQRALEIYLRRLGSLDPATEGAWMRTVVKHEAMAVRRARQQAVGRDEPALDARVDRAARELDETVAGGERVSRSVEALRALKPDEAKALMLKAQGLSYLEIGRRFGWTYTKVNRAITEGRRRFLREFQGIETGAACERHRPALVAVVDGRAGEAERRQLRVHLRHCSVCRARLRELRAGRVAALVPALPWLAQRAGRLLGRIDVLAVTGPGSGGVRLGAAAALVGLCLGGGASALCAVDRTAPPRPYVAAATPAHGARPERHRRPHATAAATIAPASVTATATATLAPTSTPRPEPTSTPRPTPTPPPRRQPQRPAPEFGFEGGTPEATATEAPPATAYAATTTPSTTGTHVDHASGAELDGGHPDRPSEFGFEGD